MFVWQSSALPCMLCSAWLERKWFPSLGFSREQRAQFCWAGKVAGFKAGLGAGWREPCLLSSWQISAEVGAVELKKWASQPWLWSLCDSTCVCVCVCVCVCERERERERERDRPVIKFWIFEHVYESTIPICYSGSSQHTVSGQKRQLCWLPALSVSMRQQEEGVWR